MKKLLLFAFAILFAMAGVAQNRATILSESFDGNTLPEGWSVAGLGTTNWSISATQNAGGEANELKLYYDPQFNGTSRMVMPAIDLTGISSVVFSFKHALDNYQGSHTIGVATSSDGGTTWNTGWSQTYSSDGVWNVSQVIETTDLGHENVQFCIFYTGNSYNIDNWYFDDITVFTLENLDLGIEASTLPSFIGSGATQLSINVFNYGSTTATSVEATYQVENQTPVTETFSVNLVSLGTTTLTFAEPFVFAPGNYEVAFSIDKVNGVDDDIAGNNALATSVSVALTTAERIPMIEHFSSSTCGPCVSVNTAMLTFCNNNPGRFTYTKYQMNWPGSGDPYYTNEGGVRRNYYGVSAVPQCFLDGQDQGYGAVSQSVFDQHANVAAFMDIRGSFTVNGNSINVMVDVMPYLDINARLFVSVNEKTTHNNVGSNGETSFHHVFMKMLTDAQGQSINFMANELQHIEFMQDLTGTHVEEMSDLEVSIWVQTYTTKEMLNSRFAYEYTEVHPYPAENLMLTQNGDAFLATWMAPGSAPVGYDVYVNGEQVATSITDTQYAFTGNPEEFNFVEVVALYADGMTSVKAAASVEGEPMYFAPVTNLTATDYEYEGQLGAIVQWTSPEGATSFDIYVNDEWLGEATQQPIFIGFDGEPNGTYTIGVIAVYPEGGSEMATVDFEWTFDGVDENAMTTAVYPNPTSGNFTVEAAETVVVVVYNLVGQKVYEAQGQVVNIDASGWNRGVYMIHMKNQNGSVTTQKLMVE